MAWIDDCRAEAMSLSRKERQDFLDLMWQGKSLGEAAELTGISFNAANGVMQMNLEEHQHTTLRRESL